MPGSSMDVEENLSRVAEPSSFADDTKLRPGVASSEGAFLAFSRLAVCEDFRHGQNWLRLGMKAPRGRIYIGQYERSSA